MNTDDIECFLTCWGVTTKEAAKLNGNNSIQRGEKVINKSEGLKVEVGSHSREELLKSGLPTLNSIKATIIKVQRKTDK